MKKIILFLMFLSFYGFAGQYPVITSLHVTYNDHGANYGIDQKMMEIGPASEEVVPTGWEVVLAHKHTTDGETFTVSEASTTAASNNKKTIGELGKEAFRDGKTVSMIGHGGPNGFQECVAYVLKPSSNNSWEGVRTPGGCLYVPPADEWCKITSPELVLEHGTITLEQSEGSIASDSIGVKCTADAAVTFNLITQDKYVYLDDGKSEITVDNKPLNTKIDLPQGDSQLPIKDLLTGITTEGFHTGSSVLVMAPY